MILMAMGKDVSFVDASAGTLHYKSVFIRTDNKFVETDYYQFDIFSKLLGF